MKTKDLFNLTFLEIEMFAKGSGIMYTPKFSTESCPRRLVKKRRLYTLVRGFYCIPWFDSIEDPRVTGYTWSFYSSDLKPLVCLHFSLDNDIIEVFIRETSFKGRPKSSQTLNEFLYDHLQTFFN